MEGTEDGPDGPVHESNGGGGAVEVAATWMALKTRIKPARRRTGAETKWVDIGKVRTPDLPHVFLAFLENGIIGLAEWGGSEVREKKAALPQLQLPIFPAAATEINSQIAVQKEAGRVFYLHGHMTVFEHAEQDVRSFRIFTSQMIEGGAVKPKEIAKTFGVPMITVKRFMKLNREGGSHGFYEQSRTTVRPAC